MDIKPIKTVFCPYCEKPAELVHGKEIYPHAGPPQNGMYWLCRPCQAWAGTHKNSSRHAPKASLANAALRKARQKAHTAFDRLWSENLMQRTEAYAWLATELGVHVKRCHIGFFDLDQCLKVAQVSVEMFEDLTADHHAHDQKRTIFLSGNSNSNSNSNIRGMSCHVI
jgi:hypothetical protein